MAAVPACVGGVLGNGPASAPACLAVGAGLTINAGGTLTTSGTPGTGTVTSVIAGSNLAGGTISTTGTIALASTVTGLTSLSAGAITSTGSLVVGSASTFDLALSGGAGSGTISVGGTGNGNLVLSSLGTGFVEISDGNGVMAEFFQSGTAATANFVTIAPAVATVNPAIGAGGSDTNISLTIKSKGTGEVVVSNSAHMSFVNLNTLTPSGCAGATVSGSDNAFKVTIGATACSSVTITPGQPWTAQPICLAGSDTTAYVSCVASTGSITLTPSTSLTSAHIGVHVFGTI